LLYVTLGNSRPSNTVTRTSDIRSTERAGTESKRPLTWEPVSGIEPLTCRFQEGWPRALGALAARLTLVIALMALAALGVSRAPFHEPFHADGGRK